MHSVQHLLFVILCLPLFVLSCPQTLKDQCKEAEPCFTIVCDANTGEFLLPQCEQAKPCAICYADSPCSSGGSSSSGGGDLDPSQVVDCSLEISPRAYELAEGFATSTNGGIGSSLHNVSACSFEHLLSIDTSTDTSPIHLLVFYSTKTDGNSSGNHRLNDVRIASALSEAAKSVGGDLVLRNRILLELVIGANFATYAGFPNPASLQSLLLNSDNNNNYWKTFVNTLHEDATIVHISVTRLPIDVRPVKPAFAKSYNSPGVDCAYQPVADFNRTAAELPWPERPGYEGTNAMFLQADQGGFIELLNFNKNLQADAVANATFDYVSGVAKAGLRHGFLSEPKFGCFSQLQQSCQSLQLAGSALLGYDETFAVQYPSVRAFLSMQNDENWIIEDKADEFEWAKGVPSAPIFGDEVEVIIPQAYSSGDDDSYIGGNFQTRTGFPQPPTPCNDQVKLGMLNEEIANADCLEENSSFRISTEMAEACMPLFTETTTNSSECSEECIFYILKVKTCVDPLPNLCNAVDASILSSLHAGFPASSTLVPNLSARCWYLETMRRGCSKVFTDSDSGDDENEDNHDDGEEEEEGQKPNKKEKSGKKGKKGKSKGSIRALSFNS